MLLWQLGAVHKYTELPSFQLDRLPILAAEECLNPSIQLFADMLTIERLQRNDQYIVSEDTYDELQLTASSELERLIADREFIDDEAQESDSSSWAHSTRSNTPTATFSPIHDEFDSDNEASPPSPPYWTDDSDEFGAGFESYISQRAGPRKRKISHSEPSDSVSIPVIYLSSDEEI